MSPRSIAHPRIWVPLLLAVAMGLTRGKSIYHGMEYHPDEGMTVSAASNMLRGQWIPEPMFYPMGASMLHLPGQALMELSSYSKTGTPAGEEQRRERGRQTAMAMFAATMILCCYMAQALTAGWLSVGLCGFMLTFGIFFIEQSRYAATDTASAFLVTLTAALCCRASEKPRRHHYLVIAAFFAGAAISVKYNSYVFALIPFGMMMLQRRAVVYRLALGIPACGAGLLLFNPVMLADTQKWFENMTYLAKHYGAETHFGFSGTFPSNLVNLAVFLLFFSAGIGLLPFACCSLATHNGRFPRNHQGFRNLLLTSSVLSLLYLSSQKIMFLRNFLPAVVLLTPLAASGLARCLTAWRYAGTRMRVALVLICLGLTLGQGIALSVVLSRRDTRVQAERFLKKREEVAGKTLLLAGYFQPRHPKAQLSGTWDLTFLEYRAKPGDLLMLNRGYYLPPLRESAENPIYGEEYGRIQKEIGAFERFHEPWILKSWTSLTGSWIFGGRLRGSTLCQYESPGLTLYYRPEEGAATKP